MLYVFDLKQEKVDDFNRVFSQNLFLSASKLMTFLVPSSLTIALQHTSPSVKARIQLEDAQFIVWALTADGKQRLLKTGGSTELEPCSLLPAENLHPRYAEGIALASIL